MKKQQQKIYDDCLKYINMYKQLKNELNIDGRGGQLFVKTLTGNTLHSQ